MALASNEGWDGGFVVNKGTRALSVTSSLSGATRQRGFIRDPDGRLVVTYGTSGTTQGGYVRDTNGALLIKQGVPAATSRPVGSYHRDPTTGALLVGADARSAFNHGRRRAVNGALLVYTTEFPTANRHFHYAADSLALSDGAAVASIPDQSGNGRDAGQATGASQPLFKTNLYNGKPALRFDGVDDSLFTPSFTSTVNGQTYVGVVARPWDVQGYRAIISTTNWVFNSGYGMYASTVTGTDDWVAGDMISMGNGFANTQSPRAVGPPGFTGTGLHVLAARNGASSSDARADGSVITRNAVNAAGTPFTGQVIIGRTPAGDFMDGDMAEVIMYDGVLTDAQMQQLELYLLGKYIPLADAADVWVAEWADDFVETIAVNTHANYGSASSDAHQNYMPGYGATAGTPESQTWGPQLWASGIRYTRDGALPWADQTAFGIYQQLYNYTKAGIRVILGVTLGTGGGYPPTGIDTTTQLARLADGTYPHDVIAGIEAINEADNVGIWGSTFASAWQTNATNSANAIATWRAANPTWSDVPRIGPTLINLANTSTLGTGLASVIDASNHHPYSGGVSPESKTAQEAGEQTKLAPGKPIWLTEWGFHTLPASNSPHNGVSETAQAIYVLRGYLEAFRAFGKTGKYALYEFLDQFVSGTGEAHFGLLRFDYTWKPALTGLQRMIAAFADPARPKMRPDVLAYEAKRGTAQTARFGLNAPSMRYTQPMRAPDGATIKQAIWQPVDVFNWSTQQDLTATPRTASYRFDAPVSMNVLDPIAGTSYDIGGRFIQIPVAEKPLILTWKPSA